MYDINDVKYVFLWMTNIIPKIYFSKFSQKNVLLQKFHGWFTQLCNSILKNYQLI